MKNYKNILLKPTSTIKEALQIINSGAMRIALIVDEDEKLLGTLTDGDIRRGLLNSLSLESSIENIILSVSYKSGIIEAYFQDGSEFGVHIEYVHEEKRMGTAGALSLLREQLHEPFFVMNGDLLTNINFEHMMEYHLSNNATATMGVREYDFQVPYGVLNV